MKRTKKIFIITLWVLFWTILTTSITKLSLYTSAKEIKSTSDTIWKISPLSDYVDFDPIVLLDSTITSYDTLP